MTSKETLCWQHLKTPKMTNNPHQNTDNTESVSGVHQKWPFRAQSTQATQLNSFFNGRITMHDGMLKATGRWSFKHV